MATSLPAGAQIGIIGGGQLGRLTALEARRLGYRTCVLDPDPRSPGAQVADERVVGSLEDADAVRALARRVQVLTYEFENIHAGAAEVAEALVPMHPSSSVLRIAQHRVREKEALARLGFPVPRFAALGARDELGGALGRLGFPLVMKTAVAGYDGRGQAVVRGPEEAERAFESLHDRSDTLILEEFVDFAMELSVICARGVDGQVACFPVVENRHRNAILDVTLAPAEVPAAVSSRARQMAAGIAEALGVVGLLAVEMFLTRQGQLIVNELAPRPHNSGHYTLDACCVSQFEQLVRAVCRLPLGATDACGPAAMANLLGDLWPEGGQPDFAGALAVPGVRLYLYGKAQARPGRKMGHLTCVADSTSAALARVLEARSRLERPATR